MPAKATKPYTIALNADTEPNFIPKMAATRSKRATATRPQFRAPTITRMAARISSFFIIGFLPVSVRFHQPDVFNYNAKGFAQNENHWQTADDFIRSQMRAFVLTGS